MPVTKFISSPLIIKFYLFKNQINNFVIHKYLEETDRTAKSCMRNVHIKTYHIIFLVVILYSEGISQCKCLLLFHSIWVFLLFIYLFFLLLLGTSVESDALSVESSIIRGRKFTIYTYFHWSTFWSKSIFASISIRHRNTFYIFIHLFSAMESPKEINVSTKYL